MNSFPKIKRIKLHACFDSIVNLYQSSKESLVHAAVRATVGSHNPTVYSTTTAVDNQVRVIRTKIGIVGGKEGQTLFVKWVEELHKELSATPIAGVTIDAFLDLIKIEQAEKNFIKYETDDIWNYTWDLEIDDEVGEVKLGIRGEGLINSEIVPDYVLCNIEQAIIAFKSGRNGAALSLLSISLESALRDALITKGYIYQSHIPSQDSYKKEKIQVHKDTSGFKVIFPDPMPQSFSNFLSAPTGPTFKEYKIKRVNLNGTWVLQLSDIDDLKDYWSSDQINVAGQIRIGGLGTALNVARNIENIIDQSIFPSDFDKPIKAVRNNLIHLSGAAMNAPVYTMPSRTLTLREYINSKERMFDAIHSIGGVINDLYYKIAADTL